MNLLVMGLPGAGKGTQATKIVEKFSVAHISTGDVLCAAMTNKAGTGVLAKSFIGKGELVPDEVTNGIVRERLAQDDVAEKDSLLDGCPRTIEQVHALDEALGNLDLKLGGMINIEVNPESFIEHLSGRIINRKTGETFHEVFSPPVDDYNEDNFYQREDGKPKMVKRCLDVNIAQDASIIEHYHKASIAFDA